MCCFPTSSISIVADIPLQKKSPEDIPQALYTMAYLFQRSYAAFFFFDDAFSALRFSAS